MVAKYKDKYMYGWKAFTNDSTLIVLPGLNIQKTQFMLM